MQRPASSTVPTSVVKSAALCLSKSACVWWDRVGRGGVVVVTFFHCHDPVRGHRTDYNHDLFPFFFLHPACPRTTLALVPSSNSEPGSHSGPPPPPPHYGTCLYFNCVKNSAFSSLVDSRRIVPRTHAARRSQQLILLLFFGNKFKISPRWESNSTTNASSMRGKPLDRQGNWLLETKK